MIPRSQVNRALLIVAAVLFAIAAAAAFGAFDTEPLGWTGAGAFTLCGALYPWGP